MKKFGLIGSKIEYSLSKYLHPIIMKHFGLEGVYDIYDTHKDNLESIIQALKEGQIDGLNVTIPYKVDAIEYVDTLTEKAKAIGAINTLYMKDGLLFGDNTDYYGFLGLLMMNEIEIRNKHVYLLGTGGAARACYLALRSMGAHTVVVMNKHRSEDLFIHVIEKKEIVTKWADIYVNATPVGTYPMIEDSFIPKNYVEGKTVVDLIYNPQETALMKAAKKGVGGLDMLVIQAIESQKIWQGINFSYTKEDVMAIGKELLENEHIW